MLRRLSARHLRGLGAAVVAVAALVTAANAGPARADGLPAAPHTVHAPDTARGADPRLP
ncbi:hypothetical protein ACWERY_27010 [Streptomyces sp. NPDC004082]|uniref:hypothetical protein n=1 Tax=unclassified Streptomyces TaxID=2593676 RepID=UPI0033B30153